MIRTIAFLINSLVMLSGKAPSAPYHKLHRITSFMASPPILRAMLPRPMARGVPDSGRATVQGTNVLTSLEKVGCFGMDQCRRHREGWNGDDEGSSGAETDRHRMNDLRPAELSDKDRGSVHQLFTSVGVVV